MHDRVQGVPQCRAYSKFEGKALVFGMSADDRASHEAFRDKLSLNFPLLCDAGHKVCDVYGVWGPRKWGEGIRRTTVIMGADGQIKKVFENVTPQGTRSRFSLPYSANKPWTPTTTR